jgi:hypothetical protein
MKVCSRHGLYLAGTKCQPCYKEDNARRAAKQRASGQTSARWQRLKRQAKGAAGYRCPNCGALEEPTPRGWLSVHLNPDFHSGHRAATLADVVVLCLSCHGTLDAPRATRRESPTD